jgi:hypothetical protein
MQLTKKARMKFVFLSKLFHSHSLYNIMNFIYGLVIEWVYGLSACR